MVRTSKHSKKFGFTMIELIFAIVIIAITIVSLPMMTQVTNRGVESSLIQEAIFASSAELMGATTGYWDERSMEDQNVSHISRVIRIANVVTDCNDFTQRRPGHINQPFHRRCLDSNVTGADNIFGGQHFDLNDAAITRQIFVNETPSAAAYKEAYESNVSIGINGNIKTLTVTLRNSDDEVVTRLRTQSANIGEIDYYKRTF